MGGHDAVPVNASHLQGNADPGDLARSNQELPQEHLEVGLKKEREVQPCQTKGVTGLRHSNNHDGNTSP